VTSSKVVKCETTATNVELLGHHCDCVSVRRHVNCCRCSSDVDDSFQRDYYDSGTEFFNYNLHVGSSGTCDHAFASDNTGDDNNIFDEPAHDDNNIFDEPAHDDNNIDNHRQFDHYDAT
jgi:hypothetical protein